MAEPTTQPTLHPLTLHVHHGLCILAGQCDGARTRDDLGFDGGDTTLGHRLAAIGSLATTLSPS